MFRPSWCKLKRSRVFKVYYGDGINRLWYLTLGNSTGNSTVLSNATVSPQGIVLNVNANSATSLSASLMYWIDYYNIRVANLDGSNATTVAAVGGFGLYYDPARSLLLYSGSLSGVFTVSTTGTNITQVAQGTSVGGVVLTCTFPRISISTHVS